MDDRLYYAQVREDPRLEIEALEPSADDSTVVVGSGGCTALSLLAAGAGQVTAVDMNRVQNHLIELKLAALTVLSRADSLALLGVTPSTVPARLDAYGKLRAHLTPEVMDWLADHRRQIELVVLPRYAPELNPEEYLNNDLKGQVNGQGLPSGVKELQANVEAFLEKLKGLPERVMSYFCHPAVQYATHKACD